jgi:hypothetical protein
MTIGRSLALAALLGASLLASARPASAQILYGPDPRLEARLAPATRVVVDSIVNQARAAGLPTEPLVQKALEGASRQAEPARIAQAVRSLSERLARARSALGENSTEAELVAGASALYLGVPPATLQKLRAAQKGGTVSLPLVVLADIMERGVPRDTAASVIISLAGARVPDEAYATLRESVARDIRAGAPPAAAASTRAQGILVTAAPPPGAAPTRRPRSP